MKVAVGHGTTAGTMRPEYYGIVHQSVRHGLGQFAPHSGGGDVGDDTIAYMVNERSVDIVKARRSYADILKSHLCNLIHNEIEHLVATAKMMMEGYCHPIAQSTAADGLLKTYDLLACGLRLLSRYCYLPFATMVNTFMETVGNASDEFLSLFVSFHDKSSFFKTPAAMARSIVC